MFTSDFPDALERAITLDSLITGNASTISSEYVDLVSLSARQVLSSIYITVYQDDNGKPDPSSVMVFMKDMGTTQYVLTYTLRVTQRIESEYPQIDECPGAHVRRFSGFLISQLLFVRRYAQTYARLSRYFDIRLCRQRLR